MIIIAATVAIYSDKQRRAAKADAERRRRVEDAEAVYRKALAQLKRPPDTKSQVLELGRTAYAVRRPDGKLTVYDEQAIMNDIAAHS